MWKSGILRDHQLDAACGHCIATELAQCAEEVLKRRGLRTLGDKPLGAAVKAALRRIALQPRHRKFCGGMALRAGDFDRCKIGQIDSQQYVTHLSDPFMDRPLQAGDSVTGTSCIKSRCFSARLYSIARSPVQPTPSSLYL